MLQFSLDKPLDLDASSSTTKSGYISPYFWDFGDGQKGTSVSTSHKYDPISSNTFPVLRVKDNNGFISDAFVEVDNSLYTDNNIPNIASASSQQPNTIIPKQGSKQNFITAKLGQLTNIFLAFRSKSFNSLQRLVSQQLKAKETNYVLVTLILLFAIFAGSLHALTPGHGKSLMAAFLIGKGNSRFLDVLIIAFSITLAHTLIIFVLGLAFLLINNRYPLNNILPYFDSIGAIPVAALALSLLQRGYKNWQHQRSHKHNHEHTHHSLHPREGKWGLFLAGVSGGIVPCVDALSLLILSISLGQIILGLIIVTFFKLRSSRGHYFNRVNGCYR